ncbi:MAG TPA: hypothetical protein VFW35_00140 [Sphingomicrobium sp.]|nr:hypothetical protein [Sphingomicrobium sp.]
MAHGYLGDGYGSHGEIDPDRGDDRDRGWQNREHRDRGMMFGGSRDNAEHRRGFSAHPDDHYRSWRDRHMSELDRDYADYCREREQQFHREFDDWRRERHGNPQPLRTGMTQSGISHDPSGHRASSSSRPRRARRPPRTRSARRHSARTPRRAHLWGADATAADTLRRPGKRGPVHPGRAHFEKAGFARHP